MPVPASSTLLPGEHHLLWHKFSNEVITYPAGTCRHNITKLQHSDRAEDMT